MYNINEKFKEWWNSVKNDIRAVVGKPQYFEEINRSVYTFEDTLTFLKKKYGAQEIPFMESLNYIPNHHHLVEECLVSDTPVSHLTENMVSEESLTVTLLLPPLQEQESVCRAEKNGCILLLVEEDGLLDYWWFEGNRKGYEQLYRKEMYVLAEGKRVYKLFR